MLYQLKSTQHSFAPFYPPPFVLHSLLTSRFDNALKTNTIHVKQTRDDYITLKPGLTETQRKEDGVSDGCTRYMHHTQYTCAYIYMKKSS